jgi:hypothetical protein
VVGKHYAGSGIFADGADGADALTGRVVTLVAEQRTEGNGVVGEGPANRDVHPVKTNLRRQTVFLLAGDHAGIAAKATLLVKKHPSGSHFLTSKVLVHFLMPVSCSHGPRDPHLPCLTCSSSHNSGQHALQEK